jgi:CubicO group peptidase (beta-lactamase class C family)
MIRTLLLCTAASAGILLAGRGAETPTPARPGTSGDVVTARILASAEAEFGKCSVGALSIAIVHGGASESRQFGHVDGKAGPAPTGSTVYRLGSVTKNFTALAFLKLEASDRCSFSDSVEKYVPEFAGIPSAPPSGAKVTLIQLATHTSGLAGDPEDAEALQVGPVAEWVRTLLQAVPKTRFVADPGSLYSYSNVGYAFLGAALERAAEVPFTQYLTEQVLVPLEMRDTVFELTAEQRARLAPGWVISESGASTVESERELAGRGYRLPAGGLFSTLDDMTRWLRFQMGEPKPKVFEPKALANARRRFVTSGPKLASGYGIGVQLRRYGEAVVFGHSGGVPGYQAEMFFDPERKLGIVILRSAVFGEFDTDAILSAAFATDK